MKTDREISEVVLDVLMDDPEHWSKRDSLSKMDTLFEIEDRLDISIPIEMIEGIENEYALSNAVIEIYRRNEARG